MTAESVIRGRKMWVLHQRQPCWKLDEFDKHYPHFVTQDTQKNCRSVGEKMFMGEWVHTEISRVWFSSFQTSFRYIPLILFSRTHKIGKHTYPPDRLNGNVTLLEPLMTTFNWPWHPKRDHVCVHLTQFLSDFLAILIKPGWPVSGSGLTQSTIFATHLAYRAHYVCN